MARPPRQNNTGRGQGENVNNVSSFGQSEGAAFSQSLSRALNQNRMGVERGRIREGRAGGRKEESGERDRQRDRGDGERRGGERRGGRGQVSRGDKKARGSIMDRIKRPEKQGNDNEDDGDDESGDDRADYSGEEEFDGEDDEGYYDEENEDNYSDIDEQGSSGGYEVESKPHKKNPVVDRHNYKVNNQDKKQPENTRNKEELDRHKKNNPYNKLSDDDDDGYGDYRSESPKKAKPAERPQPPPPPRRPTGGAETQQSNTKISSNILSRIRVAQSSSQQPMDQRAPQKEPIALSRAPPVALKVPQLVKMKSEREQRSSIGNEVHENLLNKISSSTGQDNLSKSYKLFTMLRKKRLSGANRELLSLLNKFEELDYQYTSCYSMCSTEEIDDRQMKGEVDIFERDPSGTSGKVIVPRLAVKKFKRAAADQKLDRPIILRPPFILAKTIDYLMTNILDDDTAATSSFPTPSPEQTRAEYFDCYLYISDRLRSVRQDIEIISAHCQDIRATKQIITALEQTVRFYILSSNELAGKKGYDPKINLEQLSSSFTSLIDCYSLARSKLSLLYSKLPGAKSPEELELIQEVVYISPYEADFQCYNLLMMYFENKSNFQSRLGKVEEKHPEVFESEQMNRLLDIIRVLDQRNYATYMKIMSTTPDLMLAHVMGMPEFINIVRVKYFCLLRTFEFGELGAPFSVQNGSTMGIEMDGSEPRLAVFSEFQTRLGIGSQDEMESFLTFMHGKKNKGLQLYSTSSNLINLDYFKSEEHELLGIVSKYLKFSKPIQILLNRRMTDGKLTKREPIVKGQPSTSLTPLIFLVHKNISNTTISQPEIIEEEPQDEEEDQYEGEEEHFDEGEEEQYDEEDEDQEGTGLFSQAGAGGSSLRDSQRGVTVANEPLPSPLSKRGQVKSGLEKKTRNPSDVLKAVDILSKILRLRNKASLKHRLDTWSILTISKNQEQAEFLKFYLEERARKTMYNCMSAWWHFKEEKLDAQDYYRNEEPFTGDITMVDPAVFEGATILPEYSCFQPFVATIFKQLLRKWFEVICPQQVISHNCSDVDTFEMKVLYLVDSWDKNDGLGSFLQVFLLEKEELLALICGEVTEVQKLYYFEEFITKEGQKISKTLVLSLTVQIKLASELTYEDVVSSNFVLHYNTGQRIDSILDDNFDKLAKRHHQQSKQFFKATKRLYFKTFSELACLQKKKLLRIRPKYSFGKATVDFESEYWYVRDLDWEFFNLDLNYVCFHAYLRLFMIHLNDLMECMEENCFKVDNISLVILLRGTPLDLHSIITTIKDNLESIIENKHNISEAKFDQENESARDFFISSFSRSFEGFYFVRALISSILAEVKNQMMISPSSEINCACCGDYLTNLIKEIKSESLAVDLWKDSAKIQRVYLYVKRVLFEPFKEMNSKYFCGYNKEQLERLESAMSPIIMDKIVNPIQYNIYDLYSADWLTFFTRILDGVQELLRHAGINHKILIASNFAQRVFTGVNFRRLFKEVTSDFERRTHFHETIKDDYYDKLETDVRAARQWSYTDNPTLEAYSDKVTATPSESETEDADSQQMLGKRDLNILFSQSSHYYTGIDRYLKI